MVPHWLRPRTWRTLFCCLQHFCLGAVNTGHPYGGQNAWQPDWHRSYLWLQGTWDFFLKKKIKKNVQNWTSLVVQWLRIHLQMRRTQVWSLVQEDSTCYRAAKPLGHNYCAHMLQLPKPVPLEPTLLHERNHSNEKPAHHNEKWPPLTTTNENHPWAAGKSQHSAKFFKFFKNIELI